MQHPIFTTSKAGLLSLFFALTNAAPTSVASSSGSTTCSTPIPGPPKAYHNVHTNSTWPWQTFKTAPFRPPNMTIKANGKPLAPGLIFYEPTPLGPSGAAPGGYITTDKNELVFAHEFPQLTDFRVQTFEGKQYITYWQGVGTNSLNVGHGYGNVTFLDTEYNTPYTVCPQLNINTGEGKPPKCTIDLHEHQLTPWNTMLVSAYNVTQADLTSVGGNKNGWIDDSLVFEVDPKTNKVLFSWSSIAHVPINRTKQPLGSSGQNQSAAFDYFHINSIAPFGDDILVNSRHTWSTFLVSRKNGSIIWEINGETGGDFGPLPQGASFRWQHYARAHNITANSASISYFDNHNSGGPLNGSAPTNGLELSLTLPPNKNTPPKLLRRLEVASEEIYADSQGSFSPSGDLPGGSCNQFMGYGQVPVLREYGPATDGSDLRWEARFGLDSLVQSYRAFKQDWHARPAAWNPSLAVDSAGAGACAVAAYVSWNGATDVSGWRIYHGQTNGSMTVLSNVAKQGFETQFNVPAGGCTQIGALEGNSEVRKSNVVCS